MKPAIVRSFALSALATLLLGWASVASAQPAAEPPAAGPVGDEAAPAAPDADSAADPGTAAADTAPVDSDPATAVAPAPSKPSAAEAQPAPPPEPATAAVEPPSAQAAAAADADADAEAAIAALTETDSAGELDPLGTPPIDVYGFASLGYQHTLVEDNSPWLTLFNRHPSFYVANVNVYFDKQIAADFRSLLEVRFTYLPHGARAISFADGTIGREDNRESDYLNAQRDTPIGGVVLEQVWLEYNAHPLLSVRLGQWLSPYGTWVTDHGAPVIIGVSRPFLIGAELIPERQVGVLLRGGSMLTGPLEVSYALGLSNGRSDVVAFEDLDDNKALTGRVALTVSSLGELQLGGSVYYGRYTEASEGIVFGADGIESRETITLQRDELVYAADLRWIYGGLHVQGEWMSYERRFTERGRPVGPHGGLVPDRRKWGGYALVGYRLPWFPLMPFGKAEYTPDNTAEAVGIPDRVVVMSAGLNYRPTAPVVLKGEYTYGYFTETEGDTTGFTNYKIKVLAFQAAWAF